MYVLSIKQQNFIEKYKTREIIWFDELAKGEWQSLQALFRKGYLIKDGMHIHAMNWTEKARLPRPHTSKRKSLPERGS